MAPVSSLAFVALQLATWVWVSRVQSVASILSEDMPQQHIGHKGKCNVLYREPQAGFQCCKHSVNAVLKNIGMDIASDIEIDAIEDDVGQTINKNHGMAAMKSFLMSRGIDVTAVGELHPRATPINNLLKQVGAIESTDALSQEFKIQLEKRKTDVKLQDLQWVICNPGHYWKTYFHVPGSGWCDLDSVRHHPDSLTTRQVGSVLCTGIIVPPPTHVDQSDVDVDQGGRASLPEKGRQPEKGHQGRIFKKGASLNKTRQPEKGRATTQCNIWAIFSAFAATSTAVSQAWF